MPIQFKRADDHCRSKNHNEGHVYDAEFNLHNEENLNKLVKNIQESYTNLVSLQDKFPEQSVLKTSFIKPLVEKRIPYWVEGKKDNFQVVRSEFGEIVAQLALQKIFKTRIPLTRLLTKEKPLLPTRGIDLLGLEFADDQPILILGEAKVSTDYRKKPPQVVRGSKNDCLEKRIPLLLAAKEEISEELAYYCDHVKDERDREILFKIAADFLQDPLNIAIIGVPFLLRSAQVFSVDDFGNLLDYNSSDQRKVRYVIIRVEEDINECSKEVYQRAREMI